MDKKPVIADRSSKAVEVVAGKTYQWCSCGRSARQPFCDGSHKGSGFEPVAYTAKESGTVYFCMCKHSGDKPLCDGTHSSL